MNRMDFAVRLNNIAPSQSLAVIAEVRELRRAGVEIIDFGQQGHAPTIARVAAATVMNEAEGSFYSHSRGLPGLRREIADKLRAENGFAADSDTDILVTVGAKQGILTALLALIGRGDEVLLDDPGWISFAPMVEITGATPVVVPLAEENGFRAPAESFRRRITPKTRLLILCNPHNPTGRCLRGDEIAAIAASAPACANVVGQVTEWVWIASIRSMMPASAATQPTRHPAMLYILLTVWAVTVRSRMPGRDAMLTNSRPS